MTVMKHKKQKPGKRQVKDMKPVFIISFYSLICLLQEQSDISHYYIIVFCLCVCRQYSVGFEMVTVSSVGDPGPAAFQKKSSGDYRYSSKHKVLWRDLKTRHQERKASYHFSLTSFLGRKSLLRSWRSPTNHSSQSFIIITEL